MNFSKNKIFTYFKKLPLFTLPGIVALVCYANNYSNSYIWDDEFLIQKNTFIHSFTNFTDVIKGSSTSGAGGNDNFYRPMQTILYTFIYNTLGDSPWGFHLANNFLHACNAMLLFFMLILISSSQFFSLICSLLWVSHPAHVEAVTYISGTADPLSTFFVLLSLICFLKKWNLISILAFIFALLSKESSIVMLAIPYLIIFLKNQNLKFSNFKLPLSMTFVAALYLGLRATVLNFVNSFNFYNSSNIYTENISYRIYTFFAATTEYIKTLFLPLNLHMERKLEVYTDFFHTNVILGFLILFLFLLLIIYGFYKKNTALALGPSWYLIFFIPMSGIIIPVNSFFLEHWLYLTSIGFFILVCTIITHNKITKKFSGTLVFLAILTNSYLTLARNTVWHDPITFYSDILKYNETARVHNNIAMAYSDLKQHQMAIDHYKKAIAISDEYFQTHYNLARQYIETEKFDLAIIHLNKSLEKNPNFLQATNLKIQLENYLKKSSF